jgi:hypothetical protein
MTTMNIARHIGAVFAGLLFIFVVTTATDLVLHTTGIFPPVGAPMAAGLWLFAIAYRVVYGVMGSWLTARLSPDRPMRDALALGAVGFVLSVAGSIALWNMGPHWYALAVIATALPCAWAGGRLREVQLTPRGLATANPRGSLHTFADAAAKWYR